MVTRNPLFNEKYPSLILYKKISVKRIFELLGCFTVSDLFCFEGFYVLQYLFSSPKLATRWKKINFQSLCKPFFHSSTFQCNCFIGIGLNVFSLTSKWTKLPKDQFELKYFELKKWSFTCSTPIPTILPDYLSGQFKSIGKS